jgi:hypothetical protein
MWNRGASFTVFECGTAHGKTVEQFLTKINLVWSYVPTITLADISPSDLKICIHKKSADKCMAVLFIITVKVIKFFINRWMDKQIVVHPNKGVLIVERNEVSNHEKVWMNLEYITILLHERIPPVKAACIIIPSVQHSRKGKPLEMIKWSAIDSSSGGGRLLKWSSENFWGWRAYSIWYYYGHL